MIDNYVSVLKNYSDFSSRSSRSSFWYFVLANFIVSTLLTTVENILGIGNMISGLYSLVVLLPGIAVGIRRMHDIGKSGYFMLIPIYNIFLAATEGDKTENKYGQVPPTLSK